MSRSRAANQLILLDTRRSSLTAVAQGCPKGIRAKDRSRAGAPVGKMRLAWSSVMVVVLIIRPWPCSRFMVAYEFTALQVMDQAPGLFLCADNRHGLAAKAHRVTEYLLACHEDQSRSLSTLRVSLVGATVQQVCGRDRLKLTTLQVPSKCALGCCPRPCRGHAVRWRQSRANHSGALSDGGLVPGECSP